jgi:chemotaxis protein CheD
MTLLNIGERNADFVLRYLQMEQVRVAAQDLRGNYPRRINYFPVTGKVTMRKLRQQDDVALVQSEERQLAATLSKPAGGGYVEIFNVELARDVANRNAWAL